MADSDPASLIDRTQETKHLDFKGPMSWDLKNPACISLIADVLGMANSGGGSIVIGIAEDKESPTGWDRKGLSAEDVSTWDQTTVGESLRRYAGGSIDFAIYRITRDDRVFVVISVSPFRKHPYICGQAYQVPGAKGDSGFILRRLAIYIRTAEAQTVALQSSEHFLALIELAIHLRRDELLALTGREHGEAALSIDQILILSAVLQAAYEQNSTSLNTNSLDTSALQGHSHVEIHERIEELARKGLLKIDQRAGEHGFHIQLTPEGIHQGTSNFDQAADQVRREICRIGSTTVEEIAEVLGISPVLAKQVVVDFGDRDLVSRSTTMDMTKVWRPRDELCGWEKLRPMKACLVIGPYFPNSGNDFQQNFEVSILNEGDYEARDVRFFVDTGQGFPANAEYSPIHHVIPGRTLEARSRYRASFGVPWPARTTQGDPISGQELTVRLKLTYRDGIGEVDEAQFMLKLTNKPEPKRWKAEEVKDQAQLSPICRRSRVESW